LWAEASSREARVDHPCLVEVRLICWPFASPKILFWCPLVIAFYTRSSTSNSFSGGESQNQNPTDAQLDAVASRDAWLGGEC
jgi:hypothetical protein